MLHTSCYKKNKKLLYTRKRSTVLLKFNHSSTYRNQRQHNFTEDMSSLQDENTEFHLFKYDFTCSRVPVSLGSNPTILEWVPLTCSIHGRNPCNLLYKRTHSLPHTTLRLHSIGGNGIRKWARNQLHQNDTPLHIDSQFSWVGIPCNIWQP